MQLKAKREIIATLIRARRPDLANAVASDKKQLEMELQEAEQKLESAKEWARVSMVPAKAGKDLVRRWEEKCAALRRKIASAATARPSEIDDMVNSIKDDVADIRGKITKLDIAPNLNSIGILDVYRISATIKGYAPKGPGGPHGITYRAPIVQLFLDYFAAGPKRGTWVIQGVEKNPEGRSFSMEALWHADMQKAVNHVTKLLKEHGTNYVQYD